MKKFADFLPLKPAEKELLECCQSGAMAFVGESRPTEKTEENEIRAEFLRWLILTKDVEIDPNGLQVHGAWISGSFNLNHTECLDVLGLFKSVFEETFYLILALTKSLNFGGSLFLKGIVADKVTCQGSIYLNHSFESKNVIRLSGAKIEGTLSCEDAIFNTNSQNMIALDCNGMSVREGVFFRKNCRILNGSLDLTNASIGALVDDDDFWQQESLKSVYLDGFTYSYIYGNILASFRIESMFVKMPKFTPQPYKQLAKVLRDMGHDKDANEVMVTFNDKKLETSDVRFFYKLYKKLYKWLAGYGYYQVRAILIVISVWFVCGCIYWYGANVAVFAPSNPLIFQSSEKYKNCKVDENGTKWFASPKDYNVSNNWYEATPVEYTTFQPFWYSLDIILTIVDLKIEKDWGVVIPSPEGNLKDMIPFTTTNHFIRCIIWLETLLGWLLGFLLVSFLTELVKNEKE